MPLSTPRRRARLLTVPVINAVVSVALIDRMHRLPRFGAVRVWS